MTDGLFIKKVDDNNGGVTFKLVKTITNSGKQWKCEYLYNNVWKCTTADGYNLFFDGNGDYLGNIYIYQNYIGVVTDSVNNIICNFDLNFDQYMTPIFGSMCGIVLFKCYNNGSKNVLEFYQEPSSSAGLTFDRIQVGNGLVLFENDKAPLKAHKILGTDLYGWYDEVSDSVSVLNKSETQVLNLDSVKEFRDNDILYYEATIDDKTGILLLDFKTNGTPTFAFVPKYETISINCTLSDVYTVASQGFIKVIDSEDKCYTLLADEITGQRKIGVFRKDNDNYSLSNIIDRNQFATPDKEKVNSMKYDNIYFYWDQKMNLYANSKKEAHTGNKLLLNLKNGNITIENSESSNSESNNSESNKKSEKGNSSISVKVDKSTFTKKLVNKGIKFDIDVLSADQVKSNSDVQKLAKTAILKSLLLDDIVDIQKAGNENLDFEEKVVKLELKVFHYLDDIKRKQICDKIKEAYKNAFNMFVSNDIMQAKAFDKTLKDVREVFKHADHDDPDDSWNSWNRYLKFAKSAMDKFEKPLAGFSKTIRSVDVDNLDVSRLKTAIGDQYFPFVSSYAKLDIPDPVYRSIIKNKFDFITSFSYASFWYDTTESANGTKKSANVTKNSDKKKK